MWTNYPIPLRLKTDTTACMAFDLGDDFEFELNEQVKCHYLHAKDEEIIKCYNQDSFIPINDYAQGWVCCYDPWM